ncbi:unnamed protein product [Camellia sinensis]
MCAREREREREYSFKAESDEVFLRIPVVLWCHRRHSAAAARGGSASAFSESPPLDESKPLGAPETGSFGDFGGQCGLGSRYQKD